MDARQFDTFTREAAKAGNRRRALILLGGTGLTLATLGAGGSPDPIAAGKHKNGKRQAKNAVKKRCRKNRSVCQQSVETRCAELDDTSEECRESLLPCCDPLAKCQTGEGLDCLLFKLVNAPAWRGTRNRRFRAARLA